MNSKKKNIQKTSGTRKNVIKVAYSGKYKPGQLVTINHRVFRIIKNYYCPKGNRITDGTQSSSIGEKQSYTSK